MEKISLKLKDVKLILKADIAKQGILVLTNDVENMRKEIHKQNNDAEIVSFDDNDLFIKLYSDKMRPLFVVSTVDEYKKWQVLKFPVIISDIENVDDILETNWNVNYEFDRFKVKFNTDFDRNDNKALILI
ncbi:MAG: SseB domain-containing protein [Thermoanaerobacterium thermosaccharolyticum]